jgi:excisionase family DNA binding protein
MLRDMSQSELLGVTEAAEIAGVSGATIKRAAQAGQLPPAMKMRGATGAYLLTREAVEAYAQERAA